MTNFDVDARTILKVRSGSWAYGTNTVGSDVDIKGVCIEPIDHQIGFLHHFEQREQLVSKGHPYDETIFSLKKFVSLAAECNPNTIEMLFVDESDVLTCDVFGRILRDARDSFLSKQARFRFAGYAHAQLKRIKTHRSWLLNPPTCAPLRGDFGLGETTKVSKSELGAFDSMMSDGVEVELPRDVLTLFVRERSYQAAKAAWDNYLGWVKRRNPARAELEARCGYDSKHAMHLVRLMRMCCEILRGEGVIVKRPDANELLEIRNGLWTYEKVIDEAEGLDAECGELYLTSRLPRGVDRTALNDLVVSMTKSWER